MTTQTAEEQRLKNIAMMGEPLGEVYSALWQSVATIYVYWKEYVELFGKTPTRIDLMNRAASAFFHMLREELWDMTLLHIARLTDRDKTFGKKAKANLTIQALPALATEPHLKTKLETAVAAALEKTEFCRDWRNRRIAHKDLALALGQPTTPLAEASRLQVAAALASIQDVLNIIAAHYYDSETRFELGARINGAVSLLYLLDDGLKVQDARTKRLREGKPDDDDFKPRDI